MDQNDISQEIKVQGNPSAILREVDDNCDTMHRYETQSMTWKSPRCVNHIVQIKIMVSDDDTVPCFT